MTSLALAGTIRRTVPLRFPDYVLDVERLASTCTPRTRLVLLKTPNDPTGRVLTRSGLEAVIRLAIRQDVLGHRLEDRLVVCPPGPGRVIESSTGPVFVPPSTSPVAAPARRPRTGQAWGMAPLPAALALLAAGATLALLATGTAPSGAPAALDTVPVGRRTSTGIVAARADPRPSTTVPSSGSSAGAPPHPAGDPVFTPSGSSPASTPSGEGFGWPVTGRPSVVRRFAPGPNPWSAGHRGVDVTGAGPVVLAAGAGTVTFAGTIAGRGVVVVRHDGALRTTYEPVSGEVTVGQVVVRGQQIGRVQPIPGHCPENSCLHWGARIGERYLDPLILLGAGRRPPVLLPQATTPGRSAGRR